MSRVPQLTRKQSEARVRQLRRKGCKVQRVFVPGGSVVLKKCPKGLSGNLPFHSEAARKLFTRSRNLNNRTMMEVARGNCNSAIRNYLGARKLLSNAKTHADSIEPHLRPKQLADRLKELNMVFSANQRRLVKDCKFTFLQRIEWDE